MFTKRQNLLWHSSHASLKLLFVFVYSIVVWDVKTGQPICGSTAGAPSAGTTYAVAYASLSDKMFVTGGE